MADSIPSRVKDDPFTILSDREIAGTGLGTSPAAVAAYGDLQRAVYQAQPADTAAAQAAAQAAAGAASTAQDAADQAQASSEAAAGAATAARSRADQAYMLADAKVTKITIASPGAYSGTASATYTQAEVQGLMDKVASLTGTVQAIVAALKV